MISSNSSKRYECEEDKGDFPGVIAKRKQRNSDVGEDKVLHQKIYQFTQLQHQMTGDKSTTQLTE